MLARQLELPGQEGKGNELLERLQALREQWHWHASQLEGGISDEEEGSVRSGEAKLWSEIRDIEHELSEVWRQLRLEEHRFTPLGGGRRLSLSDVQSRLTEDTLLLEYYAIGDQVIVFVVCHHGVDVVALAITATELEMLIATWRFDLDSLRLMLPDISPADMAPLESDSRFYLQQMYRALIAPIHEKLGHYGHLVIVPHGSLHYLPFAALYDGQQHLVERFWISYLPGASLLPDEYSDVTSLTHSLILAHSDDGRLPHTLEEAQQVAAVLGAATVFTEADAIEKRLREHLSTCNLIHLATHGAFRSDNPFFSWLRLSDTYLTVRDIYGLHLPNATLVTLSACETGLVSLKGGDVLGLSQGFLAAGARSLLLSLWAVDDSATAELMTAFYRRLVSGQTKPSALQGAQRELGLRYPHPFYWAGFVLIGE